MSRRPVRSALVGLLAVGLLAGCGGSSDDPGGTPTSEPTTGSPSTTPGTTPGTTAPADPSAYLPVPEDIELTAPGTELTYGDAALAAWTPRQGLVGVVGVRVQTVEKTSVRRSLGGFTLDDAERTSTPYFVSLVVANGGDTDLGGRQVPIYVVDTEGRLVPPTGVAQDFEACPGSLLPAIFAPDDRARSCLIFLVPEGATLASVMFRPPEGVVPITWTGRVRSLGRGGAATPTQESTEGSTEQPTQEPGQEPTG